MENELSVFYQREYKDKLFKFIFGRESNDSKKWRLQLYKEMLKTSVTFFETSVPTGDFITPEPCSELNCIV